MKELEKAFTYGQVIEIATNRDKPLRDRALFVAEYLSNSRVSEIVRKLRKIQIQVTEFKGKRFLMFNDLSTSKNKKHPLRNIPVNIEREKALVDVLTEYMQGFEDDELLFDVSRVQAWRIMKGLHGHTNHFQRHTRITHLATIYGLSAISIQRMAGWTNLAPMSVYAHLVWQDIAGMML
jgi:site-specific recombinase XerC